jgi:hypothetical protein
MLEIIDLVRLTDEELAELGLVRGGGNIGQDRINAVDGQPGTSGTFSTAFQQVKQERQLVKEEALLKNRGSRYSPHDIQNPEFLEILRR